MIQERHTKPSSILAASIIIFALSTKTRPTNGSTIPCPGYDDNPGNFSDVPLSERPQLARILQHGYNAMGFQPVLASLTEPSPDVSTSTIQQLFVDRPYRTLDNGACRFATEMIRCVNSAAFTITAGPSGNLVEDQVLLQMGQRYDDFDLPHDDDMLLKQHFANWTQQVRDFFDVKNETDCRQSSSMWMEGRSHSCAAALSDCSVIDPEFKTDLASLPVSDSDNETATSLSEYQAFVDKWGQGTVDTFKLGFVEWQLYWEGQQDPTLYMGRAGGMGNYSVGEYYTREECEDPLPVNLGFTPWENALEQMFQYDQDPIVQALDLMTIGSNFNRLRRSYKSLTQQIRDEELDHVICPAVLHQSDQPSSAPSPPPSVSNSPSAIYVNTLWPTEPPTLLPTTSPSENDDDDDDDDDDKTSAAGSGSTKNIVVTLIAMMTMLPMIL